jgi:hypothetical protein
VTREVVGVFVRFAPLHQQVATARFFSDFFKQAKIETQIETSTNNRSNGDINIAPITAAEFTSPMDAITIAHAKIRFAPLNEILDFTFSKTLSLSSSPELRL